jgi:cellulose synthase/poly-beta-1,6-N-acetylglucosamine synthase-like glycosyltransferase
MLNTALQIVWIAIQVLIGYNLVLPFVLYILYTLRSAKRPTSLRGYTEADYAIIVTAYEQTGTLKAVVNSILNLNYAHYIVYIVADKCDVTDLVFADARIVVLRPPQTLASNTRSHFYAINNFHRTHERLTIIDSDNLVAPEYLNELNSEFNKGYIAVQGLRQAKNLDTTYACLDAARDIYYHFYDGVVLFGLGSSATLAGSGMAFTTALYRECLEHLDISGAGFDKVLQNEIVHRGHRIAFTEKAVVYDEKTSRSDQLINQRARWINTWFRYFKFGFGILGAGIVKFDRNRFLFGLTLLRPPLFMFLLLSIIFMLVNICISTTAVIIWLAAFVCFAIGFAIAITHAKPDRRIIRSLLSSPKFIFYQLLSLMKVKRANKVSVATQHYHDSTINDLK